MVMTATVRYPVPGGVSQSRSLKMIMATYSAIVCMAPKAVVPHSTTTRRNKQSERTAQFSAGRAYLATSAAPKPPPTGASFGDFGRRERDLLRGGAKKLARSTVVELAVIRYGRTAV